jgi:DNA modification methylase
MPISRWFEYLTQNEAGKNLEISSEPKSWEMFAHIKKTDEIVEEIPRLQSTTLWDFPKQSYGSTPKGNNKYPGVTPAELIWNLVWRYTEPGDLVVDPMCGSGTTLDVCKEEGRRAICYDVAPPPYRKDVIQNDARKIPLPDNCVDLVFIDSPYGDNIRYNENPDCIGKISSETVEFYDELEKVIRESHRILKPGKVLGWLIGDQWVKKEFTPVGFLLYTRLMKYFDTVDIICIVRRGQSSNTGLWHNRARRFNFYLRGFKYLFIMRKPIPNEKRTEGPREVNWTYYERGKGKKSD